jgi:hypothetical protein
MAYQGAEEKREEVLVEDRWSELTSLGPNRLINDPHHNALGDLSDPIRSIKLPYTLV